MSSSIFRIVLCMSIFSMLLYACTDTPTENSKETDHTLLAEFFGTNIQPDAPYNYSSQDTPDYILKDNSGDNPVTDAGATLGRVLFYDKNLSIDNTVSCSSCHQQRFAFSDTAQASIGVNGTTARHSMRLVNTKYAREVRFFWDERASSLEEQTTTPIQDHVEMGFSGENGNPDISGLIDKLQNSTTYYPVLFDWVYGDTEITEERIQLALAQFVNSIESFDSKYDEGRNTVQDDTRDFPNFTAQENKGKSLFLRQPIFNNQNIRSGGFGCAGCHRPPEFDIDPNSENNGIIGSINGFEKDLSVTRAPTLRDLVNADGELNGPLMHTGEMDSLRQVLAHYNDINSEGNDRLDFRLVSVAQVQGQELQMTEEEAEAVIAFLKTLSGENIYIDEKWSDPFIQ